MLSASPWCWLVWASHIIERYDPAKIWIQFWLIHGKLMNEKRMENFMWRILKTKQVENSQPQVENSQPLHFRVKGEGWEFSTWGWEFSTLSTFTFPVLLDVQVCNWNDRMSKFWVLQTSSNRCISVQIWDCFCIIGILNFYFLFTGTCFHKNIYFCSKISPRSSYYIFKIAMLLGSKSSKFPDTSNPLSRQRDFGNIFEDHGG